MCGELDGEGSDTQEDLDRDDAYDRAETAYSWTVAVYRDDRAYGGPEEGGWWYDCGELAREFWYLTRIFPKGQEREAYAFCDELNAHADLKSANEGAAPLSSVNCNGIFRAHVWPDVPPAHYPLTRPVYC